MTLEEAKAVAHAGLTPAQREFIESTDRHTMIAGGQGVGKAFILRKTIIELALQNPGITIAVFCKDAISLNENIGKHLIFGGIRELKWPKRMAVQNGSSICFISARNRKDLNRYAGMEFEIIAIYEAQNVTEDEQQYLQALNRTARAGGTPRMLYTAAPGGVGHQWIKRLFIDRKYKQGERAEEYRFIKATINQSMFATENKMVQQDLRRLLESKWEPEGEEPHAQILFDAYITGEYRPEVVVITEEKTNE